MLKQRPIVYLALVVASAGLLLVGVSLDRLLFIGFVVFMLMMHMGRQGPCGRGQGDRDQHDTQQDPERATRVASAPKEDEVAGR